MSKLVCCFLLVPILLSIILAILNSDNALVNGFLVNKVLSRFKTGIFCMKLRENNDKIIAYGDLPSTMVQGSEIKSNESITLCSNTIIVNNLDAVNSGFLRGTIGIGETYFRQEWTYDADKDDLGDIMTHLFWNILNTATPYTKYLVYFSLNEWKEYFRMIGITKEKSQEMKDLDYHYSFNYKFFESMLDETMTYSCPLWNTSTKTLYDAQINRLSLLLHKLSLPKKSKYNILEIGCGWGFLANFISNKSNGYANVTAIAGAKEQIAYSRNRYNINNNKSPYYFVMHYEDLLNVYGEEYFDRIISIGIISHLYNTKMDECFDIVYKLLKPGGYFVMQGIVGTSALSGGNRAWVDRDYACTSSSFIYKYIFPGGCVPLHDWVHEAAIKGGFITMHRENNGQHYPETFVQWRSNINKNKKKLMNDNIITEKPFLMQDMYLAQSEAGYRIGKLETVQFVFYKPETDQIHYKKFKQYVKYVKFNW